MMKKIPYIIVVALIVALVSCSDDSNTFTTRISLASTSMIVPYEGGESYMPYEVFYTRENGYLTASSENDWLSDFDFTSKNDTLSFFVAEHYEREPRYGSVTIYYIADADTVTTNSFRVTQEYNSHYLFEAEYAAGQYYGMTNHYNSDGIRQYSVYLSDTEIDEYGVFTEGATYYFFDFWSDGEVDGIEDVSLPEGTYTFGSAGENWVVSGDSRYFVMSVGDEYNIYSDEGDFYDGTVTVTRSGDITTISGSLEDDWEGIHEISYSGTLSIVNVSLLSTLDEDMDVGDISDVDCDARYFGDYYQTGIANWLLCIYPETGTGFIIDICADASYDIDGGIPEGTFTASSIGGVEGTFITGIVSNRYLSGTWLLSLDEDGALTAPYAPIWDGTVEISASGDTYTITIDGTDDREYNITGTWTGSPTTSDYRTSTTALSRSGIQLLR